MNIDLIGKNFGRLTVKAKSPEKSKYGKTQWECSCSCGSEKVVISTGPGLNLGATQSCGCLRKEAHQLAVVKHRQTHTAEYRAWSNIKGRCFNKANPFYKDYGGRGITMCDVWKDDFIAFFKELGPRPSPQHSLDRKDNDKGYEPGNCRWATKEEQNNNTRANLFYWFNGVCKTLTAWCRELKFDYQTVYRKVKKGMSLEDAIKSIESRQ